MTHSVAPSATASASTSSAEPYSLPPNFKGLIQQYLAISIPTITFTTELVDLLDQAQVRLHSTRVKVVIRWWKQERASALAVYPKLNNAPDLIHRNVLQLPNTQEPSYVSSYHALDASSSAAQPTLPPVLSSSSSKHPQHHQNQQQQRQGRIRGQLKRLLGTKNKQHRHRTQQSPLDSTSKDTAAASSHQRHQQQQQQQRQEIQKGKGNLFKRIFSSKGPSTPRSRSAAAAPEQEERDGVAVSPSDPVRSASTNNNNNNNNNNHNNSSTYNNPTSTARDSKPLPDLPESALPLTVAYPLRSSLELFHQYVHNMSALMLEIHICPDLVALATVPDMSELFSNLNGTFSGVFPFVAAVPSRIAHHASMAERMLGKRAILGMVVFQAWFQDTSDVADTSEDAESTSAGSPLSERLESLDDRLSSPPTHSIHKPHPQPHLVPHMPPLHASHPHPHPRPPFPQVQQHENQFRPQQHHHQRQPSQGEGLHQAQQNHPIYHPHHLRQHATNYTSHHPYAQEQPQTFQQPVLYPDQQQQQQRQQQHQYASSSYQKYPHPHQPHHAYPAQNPTHQSQIPPLQPAYRNAHQGPEPPPPSSQNTMLPQQRLLPPGTRPGRIQIPVPQVESSPMNAGTNTAPLSSSSKDAPLRHGRQRSTMDDYARLAAYEPRMSVETNRTTPSSRSRPRSDATATAIGRLGTLLMRGEQLMQGIKTSFDLDPEEVRVREDSAQQRLRGRASHGEIQSRTPIASTPRQSRPVSFPPDSSSWIASNNNNNKDPVPYWPNHSRFTLEVSVCTAYLTSRSLLKRSKSSRLSLPSKSTACVPPKPLPSSTAVATTTTVTTKKSGAPFGKSPLPLPPSSQPPHHHHHHQQEEDSNEAHQQQDMQPQQPSRTPRYRESLDDRGRTSTTLAPAEVSGPFDQTLWSLRRSETDGVLSLTALKRAQEGEEEEKDGGDNVDAPRSPVKRQTDPYPLPQQQPLGSPAALPSSSLSSSRPPHATHPPRRQLRRSGPPIRPLSVSLTMPAFSQFLQQQRQNLSSPSRQAPKADVATTGYQSFGPVPDQPDATATVPSSSAVVSRRQHHQLESLSGMGDEATPGRGASSLKPSAFVPVLSTASREPLHEEPDSDEDYGHYHQRHRQQHQPLSASTTATTRPPVHHRDSEQRPLSPAERRRELARQEERKDEYQRQRELLNRAHPVPRQRHRRRRLDSQDRLQIRMNPTQIAKLGQLPPDVFPARTESHLIVPALLSGSSSSGSSGTNSEVSSVYGGGAGGASTGAGETDGWQHHQSSSRQQQLSNQRRRMFGGESGAMAEDDEELMARRRRQGLKGKGRADNGGMSMRSPYDPETTTSRRSRESFSSKHLRQKQQQAAAAAAGASGTTSRLRAKGSASYHHPPRHRRDQSNTSGSVSDYLTRSSRSMSDSSAYGYDSLEEEFPQPSSHARMQHHHRREASMAEHVLPQPSPFRRGQSSQSSSRWQAAGHEAPLPSSSTRAPRSMATKKSDKAKSKTAKKRTHPQRFDFVAKTNVLLTPETMATLMMRRLAVEVWKVNQRTKEATDLGVAKVPLSKLIREIMQKMQEQQQQQQQQLQDSSSLSPTQSWASAPWKTHSRRGDSQHSQYFTHSRQSSMHHLHSNPHAYPYAQEQQGDPKRPQHSNSRHHYAHEGAGYGNSGAPSSRHLQTQASFSGTSHSARRAPVPEIATTSKYGSTLMATPFFPLEDDHHRRQRQQHYQRQQYQQQQQQQQQQRSSTPHLNRRPTLWELGPRMYRIHSRRGTVIGHLEAVVKMRPRGDSQSDMSVFSRAA
ncbi:hypothetical protein BGW42_003168 [Actinomortierella wolfii]|nr:hypothetical protein BGW42_003168 [Actinomortierella wolfii]